MRFILSIFISLSLMFLPVSSHAAATNTGFTCDSTPDQIMVASSRIKAWLTVADFTNTVTVYIGSNSSVTATRGTTNSGTPLNAGASIDDQAFQTSTTDLWCVTASGSGTVVVFKVER